MRFSLKSLTRPPRFLATIAGVWIAVLAGDARGDAPVAQSFADNGGLKMLYDNRQYPHAVTLRDKLHVVWRGKDGFPYCAYYDLQARAFSEPVSLIEGYEDEIDARKYERDHHFAPVIWSDQEGYLHTLFGCHRTTGIHLVSEKPGDSTRWRRGIDFSESISYPKIHRIYDDKTLVYTRYSGHLGFWQYHISNDGGNTWQGGGRPVVNLGAEPQDGLHAAFSGSYNTTAISEDGTRLHVAFIWKVEDPLHNTRYNAFLNDHLQRYNLYYLYIDLPTGLGYNIDGEEVELPLRKKVADEKCLVWDTKERVAAVGPSICLDEEGQPTFLLPVSEESPTDSSFYFVSQKKGKWSKTRITKTLHPFNASCLQLDKPGSFRALMITGSGASIDTQGMDEYGWGQRVEEWVSEDGGATWSLKRDLTPVPGMRYQNIQFVSDGLKHERNDMFLFYGWPDAESPGIGYLWDARD